MKQFKIGDEVETIMYGKIVGMELDPIDKFMRYKIEVRYKERFHSYIYVPLDWLCMLPEKEEAPLVATDGSC